MSLQVINCIIWAMLNELVNETCLNISKVFLFAHVSKAYDHSAQIRTR